VGRTGNDRSALVKRPELVVRHEAERLRDLSPQGPVTGDDEAHPTGRLEQLADALLGR